MRENFLSQYKNLLHHFVHQGSSSDATTFWAGCAAVDRKVFVDIGGFDAARYDQPSIEDIEMGYRMLSQGHRVLLHALNPNGPPLSYLFPRLSRMVL